MAIWGDSVSVTANFSEATLPAGPEIRKSFTGEPDRSGGKQRLPHDTPRPDGTSIGKKDTTNHYGRSIGYGRAFGF
jgi:hypothetical protein